MTRSDDIYSLPADLPVPIDDGACDHLPGMELPDLALPATSGRQVELRSLGSGWTVLYCYPRTGVPGQDLPGGFVAWDAIPGARGCTPQSCSYRDHHQELRELDAQVFGLSTQTTDYQREMALRLHLPFEVLSDAGLRFATALRLPTFTVAGFTLIQRLTLLTRGGRIETCFYPVFPSDSDAPRVVEWLRMRKLQ
jgi:peroxiredoxin